MVMDLMKSKIMVAGQVEEVVHGNMSSVTP
jgi:hypothetical protein